MRQVRTLNVLRLNSVGMTGEGVRHLARMIRVRSRAEAAARHGAAARSTVFPPLVPLTRGAARALCLALTAVAVQVSESLQQVELTGNPRIEEKAEAAADGRAALMGPMELLFEAAKVNEAARRRWWHASSRPA